VNRLFQLREREARGLVAALRWAASPAIRERDSGVTRIVTLKCRSRRRVPAALWDEITAAIFVPQGSTLAVIASNLLHRSDGKLHHSAAACEEFKTQRWYVWINERLPRKSSFSRIHKALFFERQRLVRHWHDRLNLIWPLLRLFAERRGFSSRSRRRPRRLFVSCAGCAATARLPAGGAWFHR
jgi:hypothetical protein